MSSTETRAQVVVTRRARIAAANRPRSHPRVARAERRAGLVLTAPFAAVFVVMFLVPLGYALYVSAFQDRLVGGQAFVGLDNYVRAATDPLFWRGVGTVLAYGAIQVPLIIGLALLCALLLDAGVSRLAKFFRIGIFLPYAVPSVIAALMWGYLYGPTFGPFTQIAKGLGLDAPDFFTSNVILGSLANIAVWQFVGYNAIILFAGLRSISPELYEAAALDGAGAVKTAWYIKLPALVPTLVLTLVFAVIGTFQYFTEPQIFAALAPAAIPPSFTPNLYAFNLAFVNQQYSYSAAISFVLGIVVVIASSAFIAYNTRKENRG